MKYPLDTNMVIYYLRKRLEVVRHMEDTRPGDRYLSLITLGELYYGVFNSIRWQQNLVRYRGFFARTKVLPFTPDVADRYGRVKVHLQKRGAPIADNDLWIAAHALEHDFTLVTNNERDFSRIPRLKLVNWAA